MLFSYILVDYDYKGQQAKTESEHTPKYVADYSVIYRFIWWTVDKQ